MSAIVGRDLSGEKVLIEVRHTPSGVRMSIWSGVGGQGLTRAEVVLPYDRAMQLIATLSDHAHAYRADVRAEAWGEGSR